MNKNQQEKLPRWTWRIAWLFVIIGILVIVSATLPKSISSWTKSWFAETNSESCHFTSGQNRMEIALKPNKWSCWVSTPAGSTYRIDSTANAKICFVDGYCSKAGHEVVKWYGIKRGIFQLMSQEEGLVTITIER